MSTLMRIGVRMGITAAVALIGGQLAVPSASAEPTPEPTPEPTAEPTPGPAEPQMHNVTYIARVDGIAPGTVVTFMLRDDQTTSGDINSMGQTFEANTVLNDPSKAGMQVRLQFPYSANVHCEIDVDGISAVKVNRYINTWAKSNDPLSGVLQCGAPLSGMA